MSEEFKALLIICTCFVLLFANMFKDRTIESEDKNVD